MPCSEFGSIASRTGRLPGQSCEETVRAGDTYTFAPQSTEEEIRKAWVDLPAKTFVACDSKGRILGAYFIKANQPGLGAHVCNCGYVVALVMRFGRGKAVIESS